MKLLVILSRVPYPLEKGDKLRAYNQIKELSKKHKIILVALNDTTLDENALNELKKYCISIRIIPFSKLTIFKNLIRGIFSEKPFQVEYFYFKKAQNKINELINLHHPDAIYCQLIRTAEYVRHQHKIPLTLDYMDAFSQGVFRRIATSFFLFKPLLKIEYKRLMNYEKNVFNLFNSKTIISEQDRDLINHPDRMQIQVVPNGVDTNFFKPLVSKKNADILFNGNMNYPPNVESALFLVNSIMPLVWKVLPSAKVLISGASPTKAILNLKSEKVHVSGWIDDIRNNFNTSKILVAPMQISIGLQNKLLEAMAMKLPCVTSELANNALGATHRKHLFVADTTEQYASYIIQLLTNMELATTISESAFQFVNTNFSWEKNTEKLNILFAPK